MPGLLSSTTAQRGGTTPKQRAAWKNNSGSGFQELMSYALRIFEAGKNPPSPVASRVTSILSRGPLEAMQNGISNLPKSWRAPGIGFSRSRKADAMRRRNSGTKSVGKGSPKRRSSSATARDIWPPVKSATASSIGIVRPNSATCSTKISFPIFSLSTKVPSQSKITPSIAGLSIISSMVAARLSLGTK